MALLHWCWCSRAGVNSSVGPRGLAEGTAALLACQPISCGVRAVLGGGREGERVGGNNWVRVAVHEVCKPGVGEGMGCGH